MNDSSAIARPIKMTNEKRCAVTRHGTVVTVIHPVERERTGMLPIQNVERKSLAQDHRDAKLRLRTSALVKKRR